MGASTVALPEWTEFRDKRGLDPLGMQNTSVVLYQRLLPGISNVTQRVRYYGFYAWLAKVYARDIGDTNPRTWQRMVRRGEALYALLSRSNEDHHGVAGGIWARKALEAAGESRVNYGRAADPEAKIDRYLKQPWGAYGAAYSSQLLVVGVLQQLESHQIPIPSPGIGDALADAFQSGATDACRLLLTVLNRETVTQNELVKLKALTPSALRRESRERQLYSDLLFARVSDPSPEDQQRALTLRWILDLSRRSKAAPTSDFIRWSLYSGFTSKAQPIPATDADFDAHRRKWWVYQLNDMTHAVFETLLKFLLDTLERHPQGLPLRDLIGQCVSNVLAEKAPNSWAKWSRQVRLSADASNLDDEASERHLCADVLVDGGPEGASTVSTVWSALRLLAVVERRARADWDLVSQELSGFPAQQRSIVTELAWVETAANDPFDVFLWKLFKKRVVARHFSVAINKLRGQGDYTFLIDSGDGVVRLRGKDGALATNPRLGNAIAFLHDVHMLSDGGITDLGRAELRQ